MGTSGAPGISPTVWVNTLYRSHEPIRIRRTGRCPLCRSYRTERRDECWRCLVDKCGAIWPAMVNGVIRGLLAGGQVAFVAWHEGQQCLRKILPIAIVFEDNPPP